MPFTPTREYRLASRFVYDHWSRDLPEVGQSIKIADRGSTVVVLLDGEGYDDLLSDARHYAHSMGPAGFDDQGLIRSAARVAATLEKDGRP